MIKEKTLPVSDGIRWYCIRNGHIVTTGLYFDDDGTASCHSTKYYDSLEEAEKAYNEATCD